MDRPDQARPRIALFTQVKSETIAKTLIRQASLSLMIWALFEIFMLLSLSPTFPLLSSLFLIAAITLLFKPCLILPLCVIFLSLIAFAAAFIDVPGVYPYNPFVAFVLLMLGVRILEGVLFLNAQKTD